MKENWESISFADLITERKTRFDPDAPEIKGLQKIEKINFSEGKLHLGKYEPTKTQQIIVESGDFVFSGLNIEKGAASFNETGERLVVSANYSTCSFDDSKVSLDFFKHYMRSENFQKLLKDSLKKDYGFTRPKHLMPLTFLVPKDKKEQEQIVAEYERCKTLCTKLHVEIEHQEAVLGKLKQAILQEAIQGKLTAEWRAANPDTEPAAELLKRIQKEKARLIADKKLRPEKPLPKISPAEIPFEIPTGWEWCRLDDFLNVRAGIAKGGKHYTGPTTPTPYLRVANVQRGYLDLDVIKLLDIPVSEVKKYALEDGDLLVTEGGDPDKVGRCAVWRNEIEGCVHQNHIFSMRPITKASLKLEFVPLMLNSPFCQTHFLGSYKQTTNLASINKTVLRSTPIPLPPLAEQKAIVERVEALMENCRALEKEIEHSRTHAAHLLQAVLKEAFSPAAAQQGVA